MYKIIIGLIATLLLTACATTANYQAKVNQWQGASTQQLINTWGNPDSAMTLPNGDTVYMYQRQRTYAAPRYPLPVFGVTGSPIYSMGYHNAMAGGDQTMNVYCRTWFEANRNGIIVTSSFEGNNCIANRLGN